MSMDNFRCRCNGARWGQQWLGAQPASDCRAIIWSIMNKICQQGEHAIPPPNIASQRCSQTECDHIKCMVKRWCDMPVNAMTMCCLWLIERWVCHYIDQIWSIYHHFMERVVTIDSQVRLLYYVHSETRGCALAYMIAVHIYISGTYLCTNDSEIRRQFPQHACHQCALICDVKC